MTPSYTQNETHEYYAVITLGFARHRNSFFEKSSRSCSLSDKGEKIGGGHDGNAFVCFHRQQMAAVAGDDVRGLGNNGAFQYHVIVRVSARSE